MRKINIRKINENIDSNRTAVNREIIEERRSYPRTKTNRKRDKDEIEALTEVARASVERAKREGKFVVTGERKIKYDPSK